jgi:hypothetical protein
MGMILIPAYFLLAIICIVVCVLVIKSATNGGAGKLISALCLVAVGGFIFWYLVYPFLTGH